MGIKTFMGVPSNYSCSDTEGASSGFRRLHTHAVGPEGKILFKMGTVGQETGRQIAGKRSAGATGHWIAA
jgi:hypothetical protein